MRTKYREEIAESEEELKRKEMELRGQSQQARVRMLVLLKTETVTSLRKCPPLVGYSLRQLTRWWRRYKDLGLEAMLTDKPHPGKASRLTAEAYEGLKTEMREGKIATLKDAHKYLSQVWKIEYGSLGGLWWTLHKRGAKPKTGRRRHVQADEVAQEAFKGGFR